MLVGYYCGDAYRIFLSYSGTAIETKDTTVDEKVTFRTTADTADDEDLMGFDVF